MKIYIKLKEKGKKTLKIRKKLTNKDREVLRSDETPREIRFLSAFLRIGEAIIRVILSVAACLSLFSCSSVYGYGEPEDRYTVSALGFDSEDGGIAVSARIVTEDRREVKLCRGFGESVEYAVSHIEGADAKQLEISHLAVIVVGEGIAPERLSEILDYCEKNDDITVGVKIASAYNAMELLSLADADGYTMTSALREGNDGSGYTSGCKFYEIENRRLSSDGALVCQLPYFSAVEGGYTLDGLKVYSSDGVAVRLDRSESAYYMMLRGEFDGGPLDFEYGGREHSAYVRDCKTKYLSEGERVYVKCELDINTELLPTDGADKAMRACSERLESLCRGLFDRYGDVFGIGEKTDIEVETADVLYAECVQKNK